MCFYWFDCEGDQNNIWIKNKLIVGGIEYLVPWSVPDPGYMVRLGSCSWRVIDDHMFKSIERFSNISSGPT